MDKQAKLEIVKRLTKPYYDQIECWTHGWPHIVDTVKAARDLAQMEGADPFLCQVAAYCHDLGRLEEERKKMVNPKPHTSLMHARMSVKPTKKILERVGIKGKDRDDIIEAVIIHPSKKYEGENKIALILQDADRSSGFGKQAILRFAAFNCQLEFGSPTEDNLDEKFAWVERKLKKDAVVRQRMIEVLKYALKWYDVLLNTKSAKEYIKERYSLNKKFFEKLEKM